MHYPSRENPGEANSFYSQQLQFNFSIFFRFSPEAVGRVDPLRPEIEATKVFKNVCQKSRRARCVYVAVRKYVFVTYFSKHFRIAEGASNLLALVIDPRLPNFLYQELKKQKLLRNLIKSLCDLPLASTDVLMSTILINEM